MAPANQCTFCTHNCNNRHATIVRTLPGNCLSCSALTLQVSAHENIIDSTTEWPCKRAAHHHPAFGTRSTPARPHDSFDFYLIIRSNRWCKNGSELSQESHSSTLPGIPAIRRHLLRQRIRTHESCRDSPTSRFSGRESSTPGFLLGPDTLGRLLHDNSDSDYLVKSS